MKPAATSKAATARKPAARKPAAASNGATAAPKPAAAKTAPAASTRRSSTTAPVDPEPDPKPSRPDPATEPPGSPADAKTGTGTGSGEPPEDGRSLGETVGDVLEQARSRLADLGIDTDSFGPRNVSDIVGRAASVLEEELASGILAAQRVEHRFVDVERIREKDPDELISRLRRDVHDLVDILVDLLDVAATSTLGLTRKVVSIRSTGQPMPSSSGAAPRRSAGVSVLEMPGTVAPGASATVSMLVDNESDDETEPFELVSSDLVSVDNGVIAGNRVRLDPAEVRLAPHERRRIGIEVDVPKSTKPGTYVGMVQASKMEHVRALLTVRVE